MQSIVWTGRLVSRALWNSISNYSGSSTCTSPDQVIIHRTKLQPYILSAVSGFPKNLSGTKIKPGKFGDDAWFATKFKTSDVIGIADGVGGWKEYGIDPGEFSSFLMKNCERYVTSGKFNPCDPTKLLASSYYEIFENKQEIYGSSTACVVILNRDSSTIHTANIGDSGFVVVRNGKVVHKSEEQQHYFNTPFQLGVPPAAHRDSVICDRPDSADRTDFHVEDGDVILLATDGVFDNVPLQLLLIELTRLQGERDVMQIQKVANTIALMARSLAFDENYLSPFAKAAQKHGIGATGGKPDDITVLLGTVAFL